MLFKAMSGTGTLRRLELADNDLRELRGLHLELSHHSNYKLFIIVVVVIVIVILINNY